MAGLRAFIWFFGGTELVAKEDNSNNLMTAQKGRDEYNFMEGFQGNGMNE